MDETEDNQPVAETVVAAEQDSADEDEIRQLMQDEQLVVVEGEISEIDKLTGAPLPEDVLLVWMSTLIAMCF